MMSGISLAIFCDIITVLLSPMVRPIWPFFSQTKFLLSCNPSPPSKKDILAEQVKKYTLYIL